jgi:hypothetical protein
MFSLSQLVSLVYSHHLLILTVHIQPSMQKNNKLYGLYLLLVICKSKKVCIGVGNPVTKRGSQDSEQSCKCVLEEARTVGDRVHVC